MTTLSIWIFDTPAAAEPALRTLERLEMQGRLDVDDAAVVAWPAGDMRPRTYQAGSAGGAAGLSGAFWGLLFGLVFLLPLTDRLREGSGGGFGLDRIGLQDRFLREVAARVVPGTSALFLLTPDAAVERVAAAVGTTGPGGLLSRFARPEERALRRGFAAGEG